MMRSVVTLLLCFAVLLVGSSQRVIAQTDPLQASPSTDVPPPTAEQTAQADSLPNWARQPRSKTYKALEQKIEPEYPGIAMQQILRQLGAELAIPIYVDQSELDLLGINPDTPITLSLSSVTIRQLLKYMLEPLQLGYRIDGDLLVISSKERINARPSFGIYDLNCLTDNSRSAETLAKLVGNSIRNIEPSAWREGKWYMETSDGTIIVSASEMAHGEIKQLLANLAQSIREAHSR